jgi:hypothetical protein
LRYQAKGWTKAHRVVSKVEWHQGELYPRVGFIVTNLARPAKRVVRLYHLLAAGGLPDAANRHMITLQEPASGESPD